MQSLGTSDQQLLEASIEEFLTDTAPLSTVRGWAEELPAGYPTEWWQRACSLGLIWLCMPERLGGGGVSGDPIADMLVVARHIGSNVSPGPILGSSLLTLALGDAGVEEVDLMEQLAEGSAVGAWCLNQTSFFPSSRDQPLRAEAHSDGYRISGISTAVEYAGQATHLLVTARDTPHAVQVVVPVDAPGVTISPRSSIELIRRYGVVTFDDVLVPRTAVLTEGAAGSEQADRLLQVALAWQCMETVGLLERMFDTTLKYLFERFAFGRALASYQALKHRVADMKMWVEASAATAEAAGRAVQARAADAPELVSAAAAFVGDHACAVLQEAVQLHGGIGLTWEHDLHYYLRRATQNRSMYGDPARHRRRLAVAAGLPEVTP